MVYIHEYGSTHASEKNPVIPYDRLVYTIATRHWVDTSPKALMPPEKHTLCIARKRFKVQILYAGSANRKVKRPPLETSAHLTHTYTFYAGCQ